MDAYTAWSPLAPPPPVPYGNAISGSAALTYPGENPSPSLLSDRLVGFPVNYAWNKISKGGSSEGLGGLENTSDYWANANNSSFLRAPGYGCGPSNWLQPCSMRQIKASGHVARGTTPSNVSSASIRMENCATPCCTSKSSLNPELASWQSDPVLGKNPGLKPFSRSPDEYNGAFNFHAERVPPLASSCVKARGTRSHSRKGISFAVQGEKIELGINTKGETETIDKQSPQLEQVESTKQSIPMKGSVAQCSSSLDLHPSSGGIPARAVDVLGSSKDVPLNVILVSLQHLSGILLSSDFGACELKDHERELLQLVTDNLGAFIIKNNKDDSKLKEVQSSVTKLRSDLAVFENSVASNTKEAHSVVPNLSNDELNSADNKKSSKLNGEEVAQAVENTFQNKVCDNEESSQTQLYKKLWIEAESVLRSLKYELQLAKMKANHKEEGELQHSSEASRLKFEHKDDGCVIELSAKDKDLPVRLTAKDREGVYVIPRRRVIKSRSFRLPITKSVEVANTAPNSTTTEQKPKSVNIEAVQNADNTTTKQRTNLETISEMELADDTFCHIPDGAEIKTYMSDEDIDLCLDISLGSTNSELEPHTAKSASGDDSISSDWEHIDEV